MTDPAAHDSPSERDDPDASRASWPPDDLDAIAARIEASVMECSHGEREDACESAATHECESRECGMSFCGSHAIDHERDTYHDTIPLPPSLADDAREMLAELRRLRARVALLEAVADAARSERNARMAWLATLPDGAPQPSDVLLACEHATAEALRRAT